MTGVNDMLAWKLYREAKCEIPAGSTSEPLFTPDDFVTNKDSFRRVWREYLNKCKRTGIFGQLMMDNAFARYMKYCVENL
jgi:hypothetical protein